MEEFSLRSGRTDGMTRLGTMGGESHSHKARRGVVVELVHGVSEGIYGGSAMGFGDFVLGKHRSETAGTRNEVRWKRMG